MVFRFQPLNQKVVVVVFDLIVTGMSFALWSLILGLGIEVLPIRNSSKNKGGKAPTHLCICWFILSFGFFNMAITQSPIFAFDDERDRDNYYWTV